MSYDIYVRYPKCEHCGRETDSWNVGNYTSNMSGAWNQAGARLRDWDNRPIAEVLPELEQAIKRIEADRGSYSKFEPDNGWGSVDTMLKFMRQVRDAFCDNPKGVVGVSR